MGSALRELRLRQQLSLDDVEALTRDGGLRVTRSHLSRVETGSADLALPRFLCLMRALGEPPENVASRLDSLLDGDDVPSEPPASLARPLLQRGDPAAAARILRPSSGVNGTDDSRESARLLARCEVRLGRWRSSARALRRLFAHDDRSEPPLARTACAAC